ncbi:MAG: hypothetical protein QOE35_3879 [Actinomycetota bacterium]
MVVVLLLAAAGVAAASRGDDSAHPLAAGPSTTRRAATTTSVVEDTTTSTAASAPTTTAAARITAAPRPRTATTAKPKAPAPAPAPTPKPSGSGVVAAFYYGWYPGSFELPGSHYTPTAGKYDSKDLATVQRQIDQMRYGGIQAAIASWWGPGSSTDQAFATDLRAADGTPFKWALYYELEGPNYPNQAPDQLRSSLQYIVDRYANDPNYLKVDGKPVIFVWPDPNDRCDMVSRWNAANTFGLYVVQKRFPGYASCGAQPQSWHDYSPDRPTIEVKPWSFGVSPGFWLYNEGSPRLARDPARFEQGVAAMAASPAMWKLVTTFNEWGEGTAVEPATAWATPSGYGVYLDIMHKVLGSR